MTILSALHSSRIRNRCMGVLHLIAADEGVEYSDILALITPEPRISGPETVISPPSVITPSQPTSTPAVKAHIDEPDSNPLAERPTSLPGTDGAEDRAPIPEAPKPAPDSEDDTSRLERSPEAKTSDQDALSSASGGMQDRCVSIPPTPLRELTKAQLVRRCLRQHPDWPASKIAEATGVAKTSVHGLANGLKIATEAEYRAAQAVKTTAALLAEVPAKPLPPRPGTPAPAQPMAGTLPIARTLKDRVREAHRANPTWTAPEIANYIGANASSVSTFLAAVRKEPEPQSEEAEVAPAGIEAGIKSEAVARRQRLGAPA